MNQPKNIAFKHVIITDDDGDDRELFQEAVGLIDPSLKITAVNDGEELMKFLQDKTTKPDVIFLDLNMPRKNGKECLAEIQSDEALKDIPVIIFSTSINPLDVDQTYNAGAYFFFRKPNSFDALKSMIEQILTQQEIFKAERNRGKYILNPELKAEYK